MAVKADRSHLLVRQLAEDLRLLPVGLVGGDFEDDAVLPTRAPESGTRMSRQYEQ